MLRRHLLFTPDDHRDSSLDGGRHLPNMASGLLRMLRRVFIGSVRGGNGIL